MAKQTKFIFVTGGVVSSLGKGITSASLGRLLKSRGLKVSSLKLDPYLNVDPGTMSPYQHGEVFITDDGCETDLDLGHYERFIDENLTSLSNVTAGQIYSSIVTKERRGDFLGETVQVIPHVTNEIKDRILKVAKQNNADVIITEVGGTVGDIESLPFLEAIRQFRKDVGRENVLYIHVTLIPYLKGPEELKTKPTQHSVNELRRIGIQPDILVCRCDRELDESIKKKIALFCDTEPQAVISAVDIPNVYEVPLILHREKLDQIVCDLLQLKCRPADLTEWKKLIGRIKEIEQSVKIAIVGKYIQVPDAYISIKEALRHGGFFHQADVEIHWADAETLQPEEVEKELSEVDGVLVPGGFGLRGMEGKIGVISYARRNGLPFLGICLGMQCAVVDFARNEAGMEKANSSEFDPNTPYPVIDLLPEQKKLKDMGGTMRLGNYPCKVEAGTKAYQAFQSDLIHERHRHRYEMNNEFRTKLEEKGLVVSGSSPDGRLVEMIELKDHPWFVASQFHPEFKSRPNRPHPLFREFIGAALKHSKSLRDSEKLKV